jgi:hypothetical protein
MSLTATLLLSVLSTLVGITSHWQFNLHRSIVSPTPGDTVIYWPNGSFLVVKCEEELARKLFWAPERINYTMKGTNGFMALSLIGTIFLMISVIALANAKIELQIAWAAAYVLINIGHWIAAALPRRYSWDFSAFEIKEQGIAGGPDNQSFREALWKAILVTKSVRWTRTAGIAPQSEVWDLWLQEAEEKSHEMAWDIGPLIDPIWGGEHPNSGVIWEAPSWSAKAAWNAIDRTSRVDERYSSPEEWPSTQAWDETQDVNRDEPCGVV